MNHIHKIVDAMIGLRKLLFTVASLLLIAKGMLIATILFVVAWYLHSPVFSGDNLVSVYNTGFQYIAVIAGSYLAINVANKWVSKWIKKKKK